MTKMMRYVNWKVLTLIAILALIPTIYVAATRPQTSFHGIGVLKNASPFVAAGETVTYEIKVYNPSDYNLHNISVIDQLLGFNHTIPFMAAGNNVGVTFVLNRTILSTDPNPLVNTVRVDAIDSEGIQSSSSTQAKTTIIKRLVEIKKTGIDFAHEGDAIKYSIIVRNVDNSPILNVTIKDNLLGFGWKGDLAVGETNLFNLTYVVPKDTKSLLTNKVTASAYLNGNVILDEASWTVKILHPKLKVSKTISPREVGVGNNVTYKIVTTNIGDATLFNITLLDFTYGSASKDVVPSNLSSGQSFSWYLNATITKNVINIAIASGVDVLGRNVSASNRVNVRVRPQVIVDITPQILNVKSEGKWVTAHVKIVKPETDITDAELIKLWFGGKSINAERLDFEDEELTVKFSRAELLQLLGRTRGEVTVKITGKINSVNFQAFDKIRVIDP